MSFVAAVVISLAACGACADKPAAPARPAEVSGPAADLQRAEVLPLERAAQRACAQPLTVYSGSIPVAASGYLHTVARGDDYVEAPIEDLDRVFSKAPQLRFVLDYPFEKPFSGEVTGDITLRRTIDAIRAGFGKMYEGAKVSDIPGLYNKDVRGAYGRAVHVMDDLVIEQLDLCADGSLEVTIGS